MASSITDIASILAADYSIQAARKALAMVKLFSTDFSPDESKKGSTVKARIYTGTASEFNRSTNDYENTNGSVTEVDIKMEKHLKSTFEFTDQDFIELEESPTWQNAGEAAGEAIAEAIEETVLGKLTASAISATHVMSTVTLANIAALRKKCRALKINPKKCVVLLNATYFSDLLPLLTANVAGTNSAIQDGVVERIFGFKGVAEVDDFADENTMGAVLPWNALGIAGRRITPKTANGYTAIGFHRDENSGLVLGLRRHTSLAKGTNFLNMECLLGAKLIQGAKCFRILAQGASS